MERAKVLFGCYRRGDANDPEQYVASIAAVLTLYEPSLIKDVTDPRTGISTTEKFASFMPNSGELKVYCDAIRNRRHRINHLGSLPSKSAFVPLPKDDRPARRANLFVPMSAPQYQAAYEWTLKDADETNWRWDKERGGLWVNWLVSPLSGTKCASWQSLKPNVGK